MKRLLSLLMLPVLLHIPAMAQTCSYWNYAGSSGISDGSAAFVDMAMAPDGSPYMVYQDATLGNKATVKKFNGTSWVTVGTQGFTPDGAHINHIAVNASGTPYVAFGDEDNANNGVSVMKFNGTSWEYVGSPNISVDWTPNCDIAISPSGTPYVLYHDVSGNGYKLIVKKFDGTNWVLVGASGFTEWGPADASLEIAPNGTPHVCYTDAGPAEASVMKFNGTDWVYVGSDKFSDGQAWSPSMAIDANNTPYVAYNDVAHSFQNTVMKFDGTNWVSVGTPGFVAAPGTSGNWQSIAIDASNTPYLAYRNHTTAQANLMKYNGSTWVLVGNENFSTSLPMEHNALCISPSGALYFGYRTTDLTGQVNVQRLNTVSTAIGGYKNICLGTTSTLTNSTPGGSWSSSTPGVATIGTNGVVTPVSAGTTVISYSDNAFCPVYTVVTVTAVPTVNAITGASAVCVGSTSTQANATNDGIWSSSNANVSVGTNGVVTGVTAGTSRVTYSVAGCSLAYATKVMTVNANTMAAIAGTLSVCTGSTTTLTNTTTGGTWNSANGNITFGTGGIATGISVGTSGVTYTAPSGCAKTAVVTVNLTPAAITGNTGPLCPGAVSQFYDATPGGTWNYAGSIGGVVTNGQVYANTAGTIPISYVLGSCQAITIMTVTTGPTAITTPSTVCTGGTSTLSGTPTGGSWSVSNSNVGLSGSILTGMSAGTTTLTYMAANGCYKTAKTTVLQTPAAISGISAICAANTANLATVTTTVSGVPVTYAPGTTTNGMATSYTVPAGVYALDVHVEGAKGGSGYHSIGGAGGIVEGRLAVTPGQVLYVNVGAIGKNGSAWAGGGNNGFNGGGTYNGGQAVTGGGGGGASDIRIGGTALTNRAIVAGGGGGGGNTALDGGDGGLTGGAGDSWATAATGGSQSSGGTGETGASTGNNGSLGIGGNMPTTNGGGAGGGGYYGGGSGNGTDKGGGGGGSSYANSSLVSNIEMSTGNPFTQVNGIVVITPIHTTGTWSSSATTVATVGSATGVLTAVAAGTSNITYTIGGCMAKAISTVNANPTGLTGTLSVCTAATTTLTGAPAGGMYSSSTPTVATILSNGVVTGMSAGTATITYTNPSGCFLTRIMTVNQSPAAIAGNTGAICSGTTLPLGSTTTGGTWASSAATIAAIGTSGIVTGGTTAGTSIISYTQGSCRVTTIVTVNANPTAATSGVTALCEGATTTLSGTPAGGNWSSTSGNVSTSGTTLTALTAGTAPLTYTLGTGCYRTATTVTINQTPASISGAPAVCAGSSISLTSTSSSVAGTPVIFDPAYALDGIDTTYTVPAGIYALNVHVRGAHGGAGFYSEGGKGAVVTAKLAVTPGQVLKVRVGSSGKNAEAWAGGGFNGFNGGGSFAGDQGHMGGGGGGASDIRIGGTALTNRVIVAGGGGGGGTFELNGGDAGLIGAPGSSLGTPAMGGTQSSGGAGEPGSPSGYNGSLGLGGNIYGYEGGGGGGGGYYGGGAGNLNNIGSGAGGSSYASPTLASNVAVNVSSADSLIGGLVVITPLLSTGTWSSSSTTVATVGSTTGTVTGVAAGSATISFNMGACRTTRVVSVNTAPTVATSAATALCTGLTTALTGTPTGGTWSSPSGNVSISGTTLTAVTTGIAPLTYTLANGCYRTATTLTLNQTPAAITGYSGPICPNRVYQLEDATPGGVWYAGGTVAGVHTHGELVGGNAGTTIISYVVGACKSSLVVSVQAAPTSLTTPVTICTGVAGTLAAVPTGGTWSTASGLLSVSGSSINGITPGTATITYTLANGCYKMAEVTVLQTPDATTGTTALCAGTGTTLANATTNVSGVPVVYAPGAASTGITATYTVPAGVTALDVHVEGARGASGNRSVGGSGGIVKARLAVTPGQVLTVKVGTQGMNGSSWAGGGNNAFNGGGTLNGGQAITGGGGGGASDIRIGGTALSNRVIVAGGGGGGGEIALDGGDGGGPNGGAGDSWGTAATGGGQSSGGTGETGTSTGNNGSLGTGGNLSSTTGGGGGGGGYYGGGAGNATNKGGGGGGSSYADPAYTSNVEMSSGNIFTQTSGVVIITPILTVGTWSSSSATVATVGSTTGTVAGVTAGTSIMSFTIGGCRTTTTVTVNSNPTVATSGATALCTGSTTTLNGMPAGGTWGVGTGSYSGSVSIATNTVTALTAGNVPLTYTLPTGCYRTATTLTINQMPSAITGDAAMGISYTTALSTTSTGGTWSCMPTTVATVNATGVATGITAGVANVSYTSAAGCRATKSITVNVLPAVITGTAMACVGAVTDLNNATTGGTWSINNTAIATIDAGTGVVTGVGAGTTRITYTGPLGTFRTVVATVNPLPNAGTLTGPSTVAQGATVTLSNSAIGGVLSSSDATIASVAADGTVTGEGVGSAIISYSVTNQCGTATSTINIIVTEGLGRGTTEADNANAVVNTLTVHPNPTTGIIYVNTEVAGKVAMYTIDGKVINEYEVKKGTTTISLPADIATGMYLGRFISENGQDATFRIMKQ